MTFSIDCSRITRRNTAALGIVLLLLMLVLQGCSKELQYSQRREVAQTFMNHLVAHELDKATAMTPQTKEHQLAVQLLADAIALKIRNENIQRFEYVFISEITVNANQAKVVFSQVVNDSAVQDNVVVELLYSQEKSTWLVNNVILG